MDFGAEPLDFLLQAELSSLELIDPEAIATRMGEFLADLVFQVAMLLDQLRDMGR
jgi:hypothetical protein